MKVCCWDDFLRNLSSFLLRIFCWKFQTVLLLCIILAFISSWVRFRIVGLCVCYVVLYVQMCVCMCVCLRVFICVYVCVGVSCVIVYVSICYSKIIFCQCCLGLICLIFFRVGVVVLGLRLGVWQVGVQVGFEEIWARCLRVILDMWCLMFQMVGVFDDVNEYVMVLRDIEDKFRRCFKWVRFGQVGGFLGRRGVEEGQFVCLGFLGQVIKEIQVILFLFLGVVLVVFFVFVFVLVILYQ